MVFATTILGSRAKSWPAGNAIAAEFADRLTALTAPASLLNAGSNKFRRPDLLAERSPAGAGHFGQSVMMTGVDLRQIFLRALGPDQPACPGAPCYDSQDGWLLALWITAQGPISADGSTRASGSTSTKG